MMVSISLAHPFGCWLWTSHDTILIEYAVVELPGRFCVWLASQEAKFLRGKFVWVNWDVDELKARKEEIMGTDFLNTGLWGVSFMGWGGIDV